MKTSRHKSWAWLLLSLLILLLSAHISGLDSQDAESRNKELVNKSRKLEQDNFELKQRLKILQEELRDREYIQFLLEKERSASDQAGSITQEKSGLFLDRARDERETKKLLEKRLSWVQRSFYYPGVARYETGEWGKGLAWSIGIFGLLALDAIAYKDVYQKQKSLNSTPTWDISSVSARRARFDASYQRAGILFFLTGVVYILNIVDAAYWVEHQSPEVGTTQWKFRESIRIDPLGNQNRPSLSNHSFEQTSQIECILYF